jgi:hypothetical protein
MKIRWHRYASTQFDRIGSRTNEWFKKGAGGLAQGGTPVPAGTRGSPIYRVVHANFPIFFIKFFYQGLPRSSALVWPWSIKGYPAGLRPDMSFAFKWIVRDYRGAKPPGKSFLYTQNILQKEWTKDLRKVCCGLMRSSTAGHPVSGLGYCKGSLRPFLSCMIHLLILFGLIDIIQE